MRDSTLLLQLREEVSDQWRGLLSRTARALAEMEAPDDDERRCRGCGARLPVQARGRPRKWCRAPECQIKRKSGRKNPAKRNMGKI